MCTCSGERSSSAKGAIALRQSAARSWSISRSSVLSLWTIRGPSFIRDKPTDGVATTAVASRSSSVTTRASRPAAAQAATVPAAWVRPVSITRWPPGASQVGRVGDDPALHVEPVAAAVEGDPRLVVAGLGRHGGDRLGRHVRRVGDQHVHPPAQVVRQRGVQVALEDSRRPGGSAAAHATQHRIQVRGVHLDLRPPRPAPPSPPPPTRSTGPPPRPCPIVRDVLGCAFRLDRQPKRLGLSRRPPPAGRYGAAGRRHPG